MKLVRVLLVFLVVFVRTCLATAQEEHASKFQMKASRVSGNVYRIQGVGGNIAACVGDDGIVLFDDAVEPLVEQTESGLPLALNVLAVVRTKNEK